MTPAERPGITIETLPNYARRSRYPGPWPASDRGEAQRAVAVARGAVAALRDWLGAEGRP